MGILRCNVLCLTLLFFLLVSSYVMVVSGVELLSQQDLVKSLLLFESGDSSPAVEFQMGDTLVVVAEVDEDANAYRLTISDEASEVFEKTGGIEGSRVEVSVPLYPPIFNAGKGYAVLFHAYAFNYPLPGATISDVEATGFTPSESQTKLKLEANYDHVLRSLCLNANLTNINGYPIVNETVGFYLQLNGGHRPTDGWMPIGSAETNGSGIASLNLGFKVIGGNHLIKAHHGENANFGESEDIADIEVPHDVVSVEVARVNMYGDEVRVVLKVTDEQDYPLQGKVVRADFINSDREKPTYLVTDEDGEIAIVLNETIHQSLFDAWVTIFQDPFTSRMRSRISLNLTQEIVPSFAASGGFQQSSVLASDWENINVTVHPTNPYALLPCTTEASYFSDTRYDKLTFEFWLNGTRLLGSAEDAEPTQSAGGYLYEASFVWCPDVLGRRWMKVMVKKESGYLPASGTGDFEVLRVPSNLVLHYPQALWGDVLNLTVTFSMPRLYEVRVNDLFVTHTLAPKIFYAGANYTVDESVASVPVKLYVNGTVIPINATNDDGVAFALLQLNSSDTYLTLNITAVGADDPNLLYNQSTVEQITTFTRVSVAGQLAAGSEFFKLDYTVNHEHVPRIFVDPYSIVDPELVPPSSFTISISMVNIINMYGYAFKLGYNTEILSCASIEILIVNNETHLVPSFSINDTAGVIFVNVTYFDPAVPITTISPAAFVTIEFLVTGTGSSVFDLYDTHLRDSTGTSILHKRTDGFFISCGTWRIPVSDAEIEPIQEVYIDMENLIETEVSLFGLPVWNASVSILVAKNITRSDTASGLASIPNGSDYMRVIEAYEPLEPSQRVKIEFDTGEVVYPDSRGCLGIPSGATSLTVLKNPEGDVNGDGIVDIGDHVIVSIAFGAVHITDMEDPRYCEYWHTAPCNMCPHDPYADVNNDGIVDIGDVVIVSIHFGETATPVEANLQFLETTLDQTSVTNNIGVALESWNPTELGTYMVQVKLPSSFDIEVTNMSEVTEVDATVNFVDYFTVVKKSLSLVLTHSPGPVEIIQPSSDDAFVKFSDPENYGGNSRLLVGFSYYEKKSYRTYVKFNVSSIPANSSILSAKLKLFHGEHGGGGTRNYEIYRVTGPWTEASLNWANQPSWADSPTYVLTATLGDWGWWTWDVTEDVRMWVNGSAVNYGHVIKDSEETGLGVSLAYFNSREFPSNASLPILEITYLPELVVHAFDEASAKPAAEMAIEFYVDGQWNRTLYTDETGAANVSLLLTYTIHNFTVTHTGNATFKAATASLTWDCRYPTRPCVLRWHKALYWEEIEDGGSINVKTFEQNEFNFWMYAGLADAPVHVYVNDTLNTTIPTSASGKAEFNWTATVEGIYFIRIAFEGSENYQPCELRFVALAAVTPVSLYFEVTPAEFKPGEWLTLKAKAIDPSTGNPLVELPLQFWEDNSTLVGENQTDGAGVATCRRQYPTTGVHVYTVTVKSEAAVGNRTIADQPVTLKVGYETELRLWVGRVHFNTEHIIAGRLTSDGAGLGGKTIEITINGAEYIKTTNSTGYFALKLDLQPRDEKATTYQITASFEGDEPQTATAYFTTPDGTQYPVCTTIQYGYHPSSNTATLTVEPSSTSATAHSESTVTEKPESTTVEIPPAKTPEELQQEAEQAGWLDIWHEFTWWYPWYRIHYQYLSGSEVVLDAGYALLPFADVFSYNQEFIDRLTNILTTLTGIAVGLAIDFVALEIILAATSYLPVAFWAGLAIWLGGKTISLGLSWNSIEALKGALLGTIISIGVDIVEYLRAFKLSKLLEVRSSLESMKNLAYKLLAVFANFLYNFLIYGWIDNRLKELAGGNWWEL